MPFENWASFFSVENSTVAGSPGGLGGARASWQMDPMPAPVKRNRR